VSDLFDIDAPAQLGPRARVGDPMTSHAAAAAGAKFARSHYLAILGILWRPMTPPEIARLTGLSVVQIDRRRKELIERGEVRLTGRERDGYQEWERVPP
jgi:hypothetical protein